MVLQTADKFHHIFYERFKVLRLWQFMLASVILALHATCIFPQHTDHPLRKFFLSRIVWYILVLFSEAEECGNFDTAHDGVELSLSEVGRKHVIVCKSPGQTEQPEAIMGEGVGFERLMYIPMVIITLRTINHTHA